MRKNWTELVGAVETKHAKMEATAGASSSSRPGRGATSWWTVGVLGLLGLSCSPVLLAQNRIGPPPPVTYANRWEFYGGLNYMNFQAGQNLPKKMNFGGGEFEVTRWLTPTWGLSADYRGEAGTTNVFPNGNIYGIHRPLVYMNMGMGGVTWRGPRNQFAAIDLHGLGGMSHGVFDAGTAGAGPGALSASENAYLVGLYTNRTSPIFALGGSLDVNRSRKWALRLAPDLILEHFGTETREFFSISGGVVYRLGDK